jgi:methylmalonyl-CoA/ethylmalonyl-CoA epimerase
MNLKFHHIGMATESIEESIAVMKNSGECCRQSPIVVDKIQNVRLLMVIWNGISVELIEGIGEKSPVKTILEKGINLYHICYLTDDLENIIEKFSKHGWKEISSRVPARLFDGNYITFLYHQKLGIVEILEEKNENCIIK